MERRNEALTAMSTLWNSRVQFGILALVAVRAGQISIFAAIFYVVVYQ
jgi:hypothetical protein